MEKTVDVHATGAQVGLDIAPEYCAGVEVQFAALMVQARLVLDFQLPDDLEPAALFQP